MYNPYPISFNDCTNKIKKGSNGCLTQWRIFYGGDDDVPDDLSRSYATSNISWLYATLRMWCCFVGKTCSFSNGYISLLNLWLKYQFNSWAKIPNTTMKVRGQFSSVPNPQVFSTLPAKFKRKTVCFKIKSY